MALDTKNKQKIQLNISSMSKDIKSTAIIFLVVLIIALAFTMGPAFITLLYFCAALTGVIAYTMYPDQSDAFLKDKQLHLLGASVGFFVAGPLGLVLGAWIVHFTLDKVNFVAQQAQTVQNATQTLFSPFQYIKTCLIKAKDVAADVFDVLFEMEPDFSFPEDNDSQESPEKIPQQNSEVKVNHLKETLEQPLKATDNIAQPSLQLQPTPKIAKPSGLMNWLYNNFSMLPPMMPSQVPIDSVEIEIPSLEDEDENSLHSINRIQPQ